jgi:cobyrinic acid a,c-diamide synthase
MLDVGLAHETAIRSVAASVEKHIDIDRLLEISRKQPSAAPPESPSRAEEQLLRIAVARDEAFSFTYAENLAALEELGEVVFFSPLADEKLPEADAVYFPGGYPELFLPELSGNETMKRSIRDYVERGGKVWAEGGGMMYLSESITGADGRRFPTVGILGQSASMEHPKLSLGYRRFEMNGRTWTGHEFHYSQIDSDLPGIAQQFNARGEAVPTKILRYKNALASYTHLYWGEHRNFMQLFE